MSVESKQGELYQRINKHNRLEYTGNPDNNPGARLALTNDVSAYDFKCLLDEAKADFPNNPDVPILRICQDKPEAVAAWFKKWFGEP